jgi:hypothetical protein
MADRDAATADGDLEMILSILERAHVPHMYDHDLTNLKTTLGLGAAHAVTIENGPMTLGTSGGQSVWMFGPEGRLLGVVHYKGGGHA